VAGQGLELVRGRFERNARQFRAPCSHLTCFERTFS
jgi:hypothetical protein